MAINEDFLKRLEIQLENHGTWPQVYMFKFIIPDNNRNYAILRSIFGDDESKFTVRQSSKGKYISITVKELMIDPAEIIDRYRRASIIEDIIAL
ncbi:MAG TPA: hypothetical protein VK172_10850 [Lentimicrobium sp.]|nr:hypothetical protein [Lentimicrobium sp.]